MLAVLTITLPIFALIALGYVATRSGAIDEGGLRGLGGFVISIGLPAMLFRLLSHDRLADLIEWRYLLAYAIASVAILIAGFRYWRRQGCSGPSAGLRGYGMAVGNTAFIGLAITLQFIGPRAGIALALTLIAENLLILPPLIVLIDQGDTRRRGVALVWSILRTLGRSPVVLAIVASIVAMATGLQPIAPIAKVIDMLASAAAPVALFAVGGSLVGLKLAGMVRPALQLCLAKLILFPAMVYALMLAIGVQDRDLRHAALLLAAMPMGSIYPALGEQAGERPLAAATLLAATLASFVTINLALLAIDGGWLG